MELLSHKFIRSEDLTKEQKERIEEEDAKKITNKVIHEDKHGNLLFSFDLMEGIISARAYLKAEDRHLSDAEHQDVTLQTRRYPELTYFVIPEKIEKDKEAARKYVNEPLNA